MEENLSIRLGAICHWRQKISNDRFRTNEVKLDDFPRQPFDLLWHTRVAMGSWFRITRTTPYILILARYVMCFSFAPMAQLNLLIIQDNTLPVW